MLAAIVLFPILLGAASAFVRGISYRVRKIIIMCVVCLNSAAAITLLCLGGGECTLFYLTPLMPISFRADALSRVFAGMVSVLWPFATLYAFEYMEHLERKSSFFAFYTMTFGVTLGIALAGNLATLYFFYELLTIVTVPLVAHNLDHDSMKAARKYLYYSLGGAACAFIGMMLVLSDAGTTEFAFGGIVSGPTGRMLAAFLFCFFGFGVKAAIFPLGGWLPSASVAPTPVTSLLHAVAVVKAGVFAIIRCAYFVFGADALRGTYAQYVAIAFAIITILYGSATAIREGHIKRRLAFSTMSNLSYIVLGAMLLSESGLSAALAHMLFHSVIKIALFSAAGAIIVKSGREYAGDLRGLAGSMPYTTAVYLIGGLSLTGVPLLAGFVSKWLLAEASIGAGVWQGALALIISAILTAIYMLPPAFRAYINPSRDGCEAGWRMLLPMFVFTALMLIFGLFPGPALNFVNLAARGLE